MSRLHLNLGAADRDRWEICVRGARRGGRIQRRKHIQIHRQ